MKKFALLGAVAALATAGGVFAAWSYSEGALDSSGNSPISVTVTVDEATNTGSAGKITVSGDIKLKATNDGSYGVQLVDNGSTGVTVSYDHISETDRTLNLSYSLKVTDIGSDDVVITASNTWIGSHKTTMTGDDSVQITAVDILNNLTVTGELPTYADYTDFASKIVNLKPVLTITASYAE